MSVNPNQSPSLFSRAGVAQRYVEYCEKDQKGFLGRCWSTVVAPGYDIADTFFSTVSNSYVRMKEYYMEKDAATSMKHKRFKALDVAAKGCIKARENIQSFDINKKENVQPYLVYRDCYDNYKEKIKALSQDELKEWYEERKSQFTSNEGIEVLKIASDHREFQSAKTSVIVNAFKLVNEFQKTGKFDVDGQLRKSIDLRIKNYQDLNAEGESTCDHLIKAYEQILNKSKNQNESLSKFLEACRDPELVKEIKAHHNNRIAQLRQDLFVLKMEGGDADKIKFKTSELITLSEELVLIDNISTPGLNERIWNQVSGLWSDVKTPFARIKSCCKATASAIGSESMQMAVNGASTLVNAALTAGVVWGFYMGASVLYRSEMGG